MCHNMSTIMIVTVTVCTGGHFETTVQASNIYRVLLQLNDRNRYTNEDINGMACYIYEEDIYYFVCSVQHTKKRGVNVYTSNNHYNNSGWPDRGVQNHERH